MNTIKIIAIAITTLALGFLIGKNLGNVKIIEKPVVTIQREYVDTCLTQIIVDNKPLGIKRGKPVVITEDIPVPIDISKDTPTTTIAQLNEKYVLPVSLYKWNYSDSLVTIEEIAIVRGEVLAFERTVTLDTPLVAASPIKPATTYTPPIFTGNPVFNPNFGKGKEVFIMVGGLYNFMPIIDGVGGYTAGIGVRFDGGSSITGTYINANSKNYAGIQLTLPILKLRAN
jgi:hypothetical protein